MLNAGRSFTSVSQRPSILKWKYGTRLITLRVLTAHSDITALYAVDANQEHTARHTTINGKTKVCAYTAAEKRMYK